MSKVMLVDDDIILVSMYKKKFENEGYEVITVGDGEGVLEKAKEEAPDLILLDLMMPKVNGIDALKQLKSDSLTKLIPVILLTNLSVSDQDANRGIELGALTYLVKADYTPAEIVDKAEKAISFRS